MYWLRFQIEENELHISQPAMDIDFVISMYEQVSGLLVADGRLAICRPPTPSRWGMEGVSVGLDHVKTSTQHFGQIPSTSMKTRHQSKQCRYAIAISVWGPAGSAITPSS